MTVLIILLVTAVALVLLYLFMLMPGELHAEEGKFLLRKNFAHRGLHNRDMSVPENSLTAFRLAAEKGMGAELDIRFTKDEKIVVFHDDSLMRVCGAEGLVKDYTYEELQQFRLCGTEERIPLFSEVLAVTEGKSPLIVEIKTGGKKTDGKLEAAAYEMLKNYRGEYCIESFNPTTVGWFRRNAPEVIRGQLAANFRRDKSVPALLRGILTDLLGNFLGRPNFIAYDYKDSNTFAVRFCKKMGCAIVAWTVRNEKDYIWCRDGIFDAVILELIDAPVSYDGDGTSDGK